jgi:polysaccharide export outer membrane protein
LRQDAGATVQITRLQKYGPVPLPGVKLDPKAGVSTAEVEMSEVLSGKIGYLPMFPSDLITVPVAGMVYVLGEVGKPGALQMGNRPSISLLQALAMAGGLNKTGSPSHMKLIRPVPGGERKEIVVDGSRIIKGRSPDIPLMPNDILYIQDSLGKKANRRLAEAMVQAATFMLGWGLVR